MKVLSPDTLPSLGSAFFGVLKRDLSLAYRRRSDIFNPLIFFLIIIALFPLGVSPERKVLAELAPGVVWVAALLACLLSMDSLFRSDYDDGTLEHLLLAPQPLYLLVMAKVLSHWLITGLPITLFAPLLALMLYLPLDAVMPLVYSMLLGSMVLSYVGAIGAALTVGLRRGGILISLIVLPLYTPVLIFGAGAVTSAASSHEYAGHLAILGALLAGSVTLAPFAIAGALRISVEG
ncbi:heme exporter protein B [Sinobacterium caligoides]|uniref:Heme exporter protein B n=1 Tax=Sinobacterium caligoides TaxID=933926 RepID=A0A3N2DZD9_9GAMM|nr:heme exporter protein CcmB [Sinobacterium caligoides]ROS04675.1 heme exporter protein B [Sinobacterium caligoides]